MISALKAARSDCPHSFAFRQGVSQIPGTAGSGKSYYAAAVIDLFSRRVVGWSMSDTMTAQLVTDALVMAIWRRGKPDALLHHSDQRSQYTSEQFQQLMADNGVTCSMSRSGNVWDNAAMESFISSMKTERIARKTYRTQPLDLGLSQPHALLEAG